MAMNFSSRRPVESTGIENNRELPEIQAFRRQSSLVNSQGEPSTKETMEGTKTRSFNSLNETERAGAGPQTTRSSLKDKLLNLSRSERQKLLVDRKRPSASKVTNDEPEAKVFPKSPSSVAMSRQNEGNNLPMSRQNEEEEDNVPVSRQNNNDLDEDTKEKLRRSPRNDLRRSKKGVNKILVNHIALHIYDLISKDTLVMVPCGCVLELGNCFYEFNSAMQEMGTGAYHVGVEINGVEYAYGAGKTPGKTGVFTCYPKRSPGYQYRTTIDLGWRPLVRRPAIGGADEELPDGSLVRMVEEPVDAKVILEEISKDYLCTDYDLLRKNCCSFACDVCKRLGVPEEEIPSWFSNLAETGAITQDMAMATVVHPISSVLSSCEDPTDQV